MTIPAVLSAFDGFARAVNHGRSIMIQHREAYQALVEAMRALRLEHLEAARTPSAAQHPRKLDGERAPEYSITRPE